MFRARIALQDSMTSRLSVIADAITEMSISARFARLRVAMAYATYSGSRNLVSRLSASLKNWDKVEKRWLISFDFGRSEVAAFKYLQGLRNSKVRVPDASQLLSNRLMPYRCFHPKTYIFDLSESTSKAPLGIFIGSANLTTSGLQAGVEHGISLLWLPPLTRLENASLAEARAQLCWWNEAWQAAEPVTSSLLKHYDRIRPRPAREDKTPAVRSFTSKFAREIEAHPGLAWSKARSFWIRTFQLYKNLGKGVGGNQLDTKRGTRVYFGFSPRAVLRNTVLGKITLQYDARPKTTKSVRFGNNSMDKVNLPVPGSEGPDSYDNTVIHFERIAPNSFRIKLGSRQSEKIWRTRSKKQGLLFALSGGREFGFYS